MLIDSHLRGRYCFLSLTDLKVLNLKFFFSDLSEKALDKRQIIQNAGARALTKPREERSLCLFLSLFVA